MIRVAISGAGGKLATPIADAIAASDDLELTALYNPNRAGAEMHGVMVTGAPSEVDADVVVEQLRRVPRLRRLLRREEARLPDGELEQPVPAGMSYLRVLHARN